ncbi:sodium-dependent transporter, partial [Xanthomonas citri pv. citri]|nr:sodium-dependent transporter [Xanthomonas citri pv. citri]
LGSVALAVLLSLIPWSRKSNLYAEDLDSEIHGDLIPHNAVPEGTVPTGALPVVPAAATRKEL